MMVVACTTGIFDLVGRKGVERPGVGEALLASPKGPIAYWGATRVCHPVWNTLVGQRLASSLTQPAKPGARLGDLLDRARDEALRPKGPDVLRFMVKQFAAMLGTGADFDRVIEEGALMYGLLGDPALRVAFPRTDLGVVARRKDSAQVEADIEGALPDGTRVIVTLESPRGPHPAPPERVPDPKDPSTYPTIRANHARMNDWSIARTEVVLRGGKARARLDLGAHADAEIPWIVKAVAVTKDDVHHGVGKVE